MEPKSKNSKIEKILEELSGSNRVDSIIENVCVWCKKSAIYFKDSLSRKEYTISGLCQVCQDKTFTEED